MNQTDPHAAGETTPSRETVLSHVKQLVSRQTTLAAGEIREDHELIADLGFDSLSVAELTMELEEHFDVSVSDEMSEQALSVGQITDGVMQLISPSRR